MMSTDQTLSITAKPFTSVEEEATFLRAENAELRETVQALKHRLDWFEKQLFGRKSEKRLIDHPQQQHFNDLLGETPETSLPPEETTTVTYERGKAKKQRPEDCVTESGLRFNDDVPVEVIKFTPQELQGPEADQYEVVDTRITHKLAQRPASYVVLQYERPVLKHKAEQSLTTPEAAPQVLDNSLADVSLLVGLLVDKFLYHLPLYRQHQRIQQAGITLSRATLTNLVKRTIALLRPIAEAQLRHLLQSKVLAMDETPIKAGRQGKGKMKQAWFWPLYGEDDEVVFTYSSSRGRQHIEQTLSGQFRGTLISDGYAAYARYVEQSEGITHAQCWVHSRRKLVEAEAQDPTAVADALAFIGQLYLLESHAQEAQLAGEKKRHHRLEHSKPVVDQFFAWCQQQIHRSDLTPKHPLRTALNYVLGREHKLRVFLEDPDVPLDTNHLERALRPIPMGRKSWLFCWTELGAEQVGIIQSLITTCKLHDINPNTYLTDVLQRVSIHPASLVEELTPRVWKEKFVSTPMRSVLDGKVNDVSK